MTPDYYREVSDAYLRLAGRGLSLSPRDRELVSRWWRAQVPAPVVIRGIENAFAHMGTRKVRSLAFALTAVDEAIQGWQARRTGGEESHSADPESDWDRGFKRLLSRLDRAIVCQPDPALKTVLADVVTRVEGLRARWLNDQSFGLMEALEKLEERTCSNAIEVIDPGQRASLEKEVEALLVPEGRMVPSAREMTRKCLIQKRLRALIGFPPLEIDLGGGWR